MNSATAVPPVRLARRNNLRDPPFVSAWTPPPDGSSAADPATRHVRSRARTRAAAPGSPDALLDRLPRRLPPLGPAEHTSRRSTAASRHAREGTGIRSSTSSARWPLCERRPGISLGCMEETAAAPPPSRAGQGARQQAPASPGPWARPRASSRSPAATTPRSQARGPDAGCARPAPRALPPAECSRQQLTGGTAVWPESTGRWQAGGVQTPLEKRLASPSSRQAPSRASVGTQHPRQDGRGCTSTRPRIPGRRSTWNSGPQQLPHWTLPPQARHTGPRLSRRQLGQEDQRIVLHRLVAYHSSPRRTAVPMPREAASACLISTFAADSTPSDEVSAWSGRRQEKRPAVTRAGARARALPGVGPSTGSWEGLDCTRSWQSPGQIAAVLHDLSRASRQLHCCRQPWRGSTKISSLGPDDLRLEPSISLHLNETLFRGVAPISRSRRTRSLRAISSTQDTSTPDDICWTNKLKITHNPLPRPRSRQC